MDTSAAASTSPPGTAQTLPVVLVVDDVPSNVRVLRAALEANHHILSAANGQDALALASSARPDLILLDIRMPGIDGFAVCRQLKAQAATRDIPVIFVTAMDETENEAEGFAAGGVDYIHKPFNIPLLLERVKTHLNLHAQRRNLEGMFEGVLEFAPDAFILSGPDDVIVRVNHRAEQLFGYSRQEMVGAPAAMLIPARLHAQHQENLRDWAQDPQAPTSSATDTCLRKDGSEFPVEINISALQTATGPLFMAVVRDISERKRQEDELREAARYARSLFEASLDPLVMIDPTGKISDVNVAAETITGLSRTQLIGSDAAAKFTEPEKLYQGFQRVLLENQVRDYPMAIRHVSGKTTDVVCNASLYRNAQGRVVGVFASAHDLTESQRIQKELRRSRQRLRELGARLEATREEERKHIAREVHDELGQVLTALRIDNALLRIKFGPADPLLQEKIEDMRQLIDRGVQGVRNVARALRPAALDMGLLPAIEWLCNESASRNGLPCALHAADSHIDIPEARAVMVFRIVQESLTNIARYARATQIDITLTQEGDALRVEVRDDGQGFDPAQAAAKKSFGLLGMRERALALGGQLDIHSAPGQGATIALTIPLAPDDARESSA